jgi:hypothetical protein
MHVHFDFLKKLGGKFSGSMEVGGHAKFYFFGGGSHIFEIIEWKGVKSFFGRNGG